MNEIDKLTDEQHSNQSLQPQVEIVDLGHREEEQPLLLDKLEGLRRELNTQ